MADDFAHGTVHTAAPDMQAAVEADAATRALWQALAPLGRNEFICWVEDAKQPATRLRRIERTREELCARASAAPAAGRAASTAPTKRRASGGRRC